MQKVVVLGSTGMAGHVISLYLEEQGYSVFRISRSEKLTENSMPVDITNFVELKKCLDKANPEIIINCIGLLVKEADQNPEKAILVNAYMPKWLENEYKSSRVRLIHLSTDCVFSGREGMYREDDFQDGPTVYDRTKALGEIKNEKDLTFRMSIIGPDTDIQGTGLFNWFMKQTGSIGGYSKAIWNGITTIELARGIQAAIKSNLCGLYHLVPDATIDKYSLLMLFQKIFDKEDLGIVKNTEYAVDKSLINTRKDFDFKVRNYEEQIKDMKNWIEAHRNIYPHYFLNEETE